MDQEYFPEIINEKGEENLKGYKIFQTILSALVLVSCLLIIYECLSIYLPAAAEGKHDHIYSAEIVAQHFTRIQIPVIACVLLSIAGIVTAPFYAGGKKNATLPDAENMADLYLSKMPADSGKDSPEWNVVRKETAWRRKLTTIGVLIGAVCICWSLYFIIDPDRFESLDFDQVTGSLLLCIIPPVCLALVSAAVLSYKSSDSWARQLEAMKIICKNNKEKDTAPKDTALKDTAALRSRRIFIARTVLLAAAVVMLLLGNANGGRFDVLAKAIAICSECIGLG